MVGAAVGGRPPGRPPRRPLTRAELSRLRARRRALVRRRRLVLLTGLGGLVVLVVGLSLGSSAEKAGAGRAARPLRASAPRRTSTARVVRTRLLAWRLPSAVSREVVVPAPGGRLMVLGGLDAAGGTVATSYELNPVTGRATPSRPLVEATHDAAGTLLGKAALVLGGGTAAPASEAQVVVEGGPVRVAGQLPQPRSDGRAVTLGRTAYLVGGYSGPSMDPAVLATRDGRRFEVVATLPDPVRYPTLGAVGGDLYVFGGQGPSGAPVTTIQRVDPRTGRASVVGRLGVALEAAVAGRLGGTLYLAGGLVPGPSGAPVASRAVYAYEPGAHSLRRVATLAVPVANAGGTVVGNRLYVVGGEGVSGAPVGEVQVVELGRSRAGA